MPRQVNGRLLLWTFACLAVLVSAVHVVHSAQMHRQCGAILSEAEKAMDRKQYGKATELYQMYLGYQPDDTSAIAQFAVALQQSSAGARAKSKLYLLLEQVVRRHPQDHQTRQRAAQAAIDIGRFADAVFHLEHLLASAPHNATIVQQLGWCQGKVGKYEEAAKSYERAISFSPHQTDSYLLLAELLTHRRQQPDAAAKVLNEMVANNVTSWQALHARARFRLRHGQAELAAEDFFAACALAPDQAETMQAGAEMEFLRGHWDQARAFAQRGLNLNPKNESLYRFLARLEGEQKRYAAALACLQTGLAELPKSTALRIDLTSLSLELLLNENVIREAEAAVLLAELRQLEGENGIQWRTTHAVRAIARARRGDNTLLLEARGHLAEIRRRHGEVAQAVLLEAQLNELDGRTHEAIALYVRAFDMGHRQPALVLRVSQWLAERQHFAQAEQILRRFEEQAPLTAAHARLGAELALQSNDQGRAAALARTAVSETTKDYRDLVWLGRVLWLTGDVKDATRALQNATQLAPGVPETWVALARHLTRIQQPRLLEEVLSEMRERVPADRVEYTTALCLEACGRLKEAVAIHKKRLDESPADNAICKQVAEFYLRTDQLAYAEPLLRLLCTPSASIGPELTQWSRRQLALVLAARGDFDEALALVYQNVGPTGFAVEDQRIECFVLSRMPGRQAEARRFFERTIDEQPMTASERFLLAQVHAAAADHQKADIYMHGLLAIDRDNADYLAFHIQSLLHRGEETSARVYFELLELLEPGSARTLKLKSRL